MTDSALPALTLDTLLGFLRDQGYTFEVEETDGRRLARLDWRFQMGDATVLVAVDGGPNDSARLSITCATAKTYAPRRAGVLEDLNRRNRARAFSRSLDDEGRVWLEYVGFYPTHVDFPQDTFETLLQGALVYFHDDYAALEGVRIEPQRPS